MTEQEREELALLASWVEHPGCEVFCRRTQERIDQWRAGFPFNIKDAEELTLAKGQMGVLLEFLTMRERVLELHNNPDMFEELPD